MTDTIRVKFLGEERTFVYQKTDIFGAHYVAVINGVKFVLSENDYVHPWGMWMMPQQREGRVANTPQAAAEAWEELWRPVAQALAIISGGRLSKRNPWSMLNEIGDALEPMIGTTQDVDHVLECHADGLPVYFRSMCKAVEKAHKVLCMTEAEIDAMEKAGAL